MILTRVKQFLLISQKTPKTKIYLRDAGDASNVTFSPAQDSSRSEESSNTLSSYKNSDILKPICKKIVITFFLESTSQQSISDD